MGDWYNNKLKDPRWQKKRLKILSRDNFTCSFCNNDKEELVVHHLEYYKNPWDIQDYKLVTLCSTCHKSFHDGENDGGSLLWWLDAIKKEPLLISARLEFISIRNRFIKQPYFDSVYYYMLWKQLVLSDRDYYFGTNRSWDFPLVGDFSRNSNLGNSIDYDKCLDLPELWYEIDMYRGLKEACADNENLLLDDCLG